jgi:hypothetical protein
LIVKLWAGGGAPPSASVKERLKTDRLTDGPTFRVTGMITGELTAAAEVIVTVPVYVPFGMPAGLTVTARLDGVVADCGATESHAEPVVVEAVAVMLTELPAATVRYCVLAAGPPGDDEKLRLPGSACRSWPTFKVTGTTTGLLSAVGAVKVTEPE